MQVLTSLATSRSLSFKNNSPVRASQGHFQSPLLAAKINPVFLLTSVFLIDSEFGV